MFDRKNYKEKAKIVIKKDYWNYFIAILITSILTISDNFSIKYSSSDMVGNQSQNVVIKLFGMDITSEIYQIIFVGVIFAIVLFFIGIAINVFIFNVIEFGSVNYALEAREENYQISGILAGFDKDIYLNVVLVNFMYKLQILLFSFLLVIPGIIKMYQLYFVNYILADNPSISYQEAIERSTAMTNGFKMELLILDLSFIPWQLLNIVSFGLFKYFLNPYIAATKAEAYTALKSEI